MTNQTFTDYNTGTVIDPTDVSYLSLSLTADIALSWPSYVPPSTVIGVTPLIAAARTMEITPSGGAWKIALPQGNLGSVGQSILFVNRGAIAFTVTDVSGGNTTSVGAGASLYFFLVNNTTITGIWHSQNFGTGTSAADANLLAGAGLSSLNGVINETINVVQFSSQGYSLNDNSRANAYVWTGGLSTLKLPAVSSLSPGWFMILRNQGTGTITATPTESTTLINGQANAPFQVGTASWIVFSSTTNSFFTLGTVGTQNFSFSSATYNVDAIPLNTLNLTTGAPIIQRYVAPTGTRTATLAVTYPAVASIYTVVNATTSSTYNLTFTLAGSSQTPITVKANTQAFLTSDGINLYLLSSQLLGAFQLGPGSAAAPSLSFLADSSTGVYQPNTSQLGLAAGASAIMTLDGSDPANLNVYSPATATFKAIDGGLI